MMTMKKLNYETPLCESMQMVAESAMLLAGSPGAPGSDLNPLDPINYAPAISDQIAF